MLDRHALAPAFDEVAQGVEFLGVQRPVEDHVEVHPPLDPEDVGEEQVDVEPRALDPFVREVFGGGFEDFEDGFHRRGAQLGPDDRRTQRSNVAASCAGRGFRVAMFSWSQTCSPKAT